VTAKSYQSERFSECVNYVTYFINCITGGKNRCISLFRFFIGYWINTGLDFYPGPFCI